MRVTAAIVFIATSMSCATMATAQTAPGRALASTAETLRGTDVSAQERRRPRVRIYRETYDRGVYPSYFPGSNAVRDCSVQYVREFRPSGTVIVPNMRCFWRQP